MSEWLKKLWYVYTMEYYLAIKNETSPFPTTWVVLQGIMISDILFIRNRKQSTVYKMRTDYNWNKCFIM